MDDSGNYLDIQKNEGTGIGLALTKEYVKLMKGKVDVKSELGMGTTFTIKLPITNNSTISEAFISTESPDIQNSEKLKSSDLQKNRRPN